jgi:hypothetical protein
MYEFYKFKNYMKVINIMKYFQNKCQIFTLKHKSKNLFNRFFLNWIFFILIINSLHNYILYQSFYMSNFLMVIL